METFRALAAAFLITLGLGQSPALAQGGGCISDRESRQLLEQRQIRPFPDAMRSAGLTPDQVVEVQLCRGGGGFVYRVRVLQRDGEVRPVNIPAG